jgi:hypothetical protein
MYGHRWRWHVVENLNICLNSDRWYYVVFGLYILPCGGVLRYIALSIAPNRIDVYPWMQWIQSPKRYVLNKIRTVVTVQKLNIVQCYMISYSLKLVTLRAVAKALYRYRFYLWYVSEYLNVRFHPHRKHNRDSIIKTSHLVLFAEITLTYCRIHTKYTNIMCGHNAEVSNAKACTWEG